MDWDKMPHKPSGHDQPQDLEEVLRNLKVRLDPYFKKGSFGMIGMIGLIFLVAFLAFNSYFIIEPQQTGIVQRFGKYVRSVHPGLHFKYPFGIETVRKVVTDKVPQREYGYRTLEPGVRSRFEEKGHEDEAMMLSGDLNVVDLQWTVQYRINDPVAYLFHVKNVESTLDDISESVVRRIVGNRYADDVLTVGRASIEDKSKTEMQQILDQYGTGLQIITVKLQNANPPASVRAAFNEVNEAGQEKERMINDAQQAYNQKIPKAMGEARQVITQAEGYALERVNRAQGEAHRFEDIVSEYVKAPEVTRRRMYIEALGDLMGHMGHIFVLDEKQQNLLPLLDLNKHTVSSSVPAGQSDAASSQANKAAAKEGK